jgi:hypothetical protein
LLRSGASELDPKVAQTLVDLEKGLYAAVLQRGTSATADARESDVSAIRSIADEHAYWVLNHSHNIMNGMLMGVCVYE